MISITPTTLFAQSFKSPTAVLFCPSAFSRRSISAINTRQVVAHSGCPSIVLEYRKVERVSTHRDDRIDWQSQLHNVGPREQVGDRAGGDECTGARVDTDRCQWIVQLNRVTVDQGMNGEHSLRLYRRKRRDECVYFAVQSSEFRIVRRKGTSENRKES
jgi:hypothetical protein